MSPTIVRGSAAALMLLALLSGAACRTAARSTGTSETAGQKAVKIQIDDYLKRISIAQDDGRREDLDQYVLDLQAVVHEHFAMLLAMIQKGTLEDKVLAAGALGFSKDRSVIPYLLGTLRPDVPPDVRTNALGSLGFMGSVETPTEPIFESMKDRNPEIRAAACYATGRIIRPGDDRGASGPLIRALDDEDWRVRNNAAVALMNSGSRSATTALVLRGLRDVNPRVRVNSALALGELRDPAAVEPLVEALQAEDTLQVHAAAEALEKITGQKFGRSYPLWKDWWEAQRAKESETDARKPPQAPPDAPAPNR